MIEIQWMFLRELDFPSILRSISPFIHETYMKAQDEQDIEIIL